MEQSRIFIASSERAHTFAKMIRTSVNDDEHYSAETWKDALSSSGAQSKIEALEAWVKIYDYAIIIFTKADLLSKEAGNDSRSRDDCVFEAGLFMALLGRQRCMLLSSVETSDLPSDLGGITLMRFKEPDDLANYDKCRQAVDAAAEAIQAMVQRSVSGRSPANRPLTRDALLKRERIESQGGVLREDQVVVASVQPPELQYDVARQVRTNMESNIRYVYFFRGNLDAADKIPQLLQLMLLTDLLEKKDASSFKTRRELISLHRQEIIKTIIDMCEVDKLNIFFLGDPIYPEFCIHNAASDKLARLYYCRDDDCYIEWSYGADAYRFWCAVKDQNRVDNPESPYAIFHRGQNFNLNEDTFKRNLTMGMRKYFGEIADDVIGLCLNGPDYKPDQIPRSSAPVSAVQPTG